MSDVEPRDARADAQLVERLKSGEIDALGLLYQRHGQAVRTLLLRMDPTLSAEDAADLCQETFLTFQSTLSRYREEGKLRGWIYGIAVKKARSFRRRRWWRWNKRREVGRNAAGVSLYAADSEAQVAARERIDHALKALPEAQREVLVLHAIEGLSVKETAAALGVPENAVSTRLYRARKTLAEVP